MQPPRGKSLRARLSLVAILVTIAQVVTRVVLDWRHERAEAGQWSLVSQLASELEARRVARKSPGESPATVVQLGVAQKG
jgi:hypothetical protein